MEIPGGVSKQKNTLRLHWKGHDVCQGQLQQQLGGPSIIGRPLKLMFGATTHYGKVILQHVEVVYQGRGDARTQWRVEFEYGEEFDFNYDELLHGFNMFTRERVSRAIYIPNDHGDLGRPGAVNGRAQRAIGRAQQNEFIEADTSEDEDGEDLDV